MFFSIILLGVLCAIATSTPLDDWVWAPDDHYGWYDTGVKINGSYESCTYTAVIVPNPLRFTRNATLWIVGGHQDNTLPGNIFEQNPTNMNRSLSMACMLGMITGVLFQVPNQNVPNQNVIFSSDPIQEVRDEDAVIAFTWRHFIDDPTDPNWLVRFPMVKAPILAMDTITAFVSQNLGELGCQLDYYSVMGESKRGWTTWLVGAVDPSRVKLIIPIVLDAINFVAVEHHEYRSYGAWSYALDDYIAQGLAQRFDGSNMKLLQQMEDPYFYLDRLVMPKLIVNAAMDEIQQPDDSHYWWDACPEPKHFLLVPNAEHEMTLNYDAGWYYVLPSIAAFVKGHVMNKPIPTFTWNISNSTGEIVATVNFDGEIHEANVWWALSCGFNSWDGNKTRRDYRMAHMDNPCYCGRVDNSSDPPMCINLAALWSKEQVQPAIVNGKRVYSAQFPKPDPGRWIAFFIAFKFYNPDPEFIYDLSHFEQPKSLKHHYISLFGETPDNREGYLTFNTEVSIWPAEFPYEDCNGPSCGNREV
uniref:Uncharacterized protein n=1 Tax=Acrobeloides nanus TaxID=290746 RepID=A0A914C0A9_9BILA